ncbi:MAG: tRNA adenosine(34) deaminase TadA [Burkholderiaceae bacterium]|nr:tRNA adenosine(34) deaminase TadA [Burkholderiaceae bacterium]
MTQDIAFMRLALAQAREAHQAGEVPVGAIVVKEGRVVGVGRNMCIGSDDPSAHAEVIALRAAAKALGNYRLDGCELYVTLEPCTMCAGAVLHARLKRVIYGAADPKTGAAGSVLNLFDNPQLNHHTQVSEGVLADECSSALRTFFQARRQAKGGQALMENALRTPLSVFAAMQDYPFAPHFFIDAENLQGWRLHYLDEGPAEAAHAVLCLHGMPGWSYRYRMLIPLLCAKGIRVLVPDLIGFGVSDKPKKMGAHTTNLHLISLQLLLKFLGRPKVLILAEGAAIHLARMLAHSHVVPVIDVLQVPSDPHVASDMRPYPDKGYQAARKASAGLVLQLEQASGRANRDSVSRLLDGGAEAMAEQIEAICCSG